MHSSTRRWPIPSPRARGSTRSNRSRATVSDSLTRNTEPTFSPSRSAIQQRSRFRSYCLMNLATISATSASNCSSQPYSCAYSSPWRCTTQPMSPGRCGRSRYGTRRSGPAPSSTGSSPRWRRSPVLLRVREPLEQRADVGARLGVEPGERPPPGGGEAHEALPGVAGRGLPVDQAALHEPAQDATQIPRVEAQLPAQLRRRRLVALRQLVQDARRGERERAVQEPFVEQADLLRVEPIEAPHDCDALLQVGGRHGES